MKRRLLLTWLGKHDLDAEAEGTLGPIGSILVESDAPYDEVKILTNNWFDRISDYQIWLSKTLRSNRRSTKIIIDTVKIKSPIDYPSIYAIAEKELSQTSLDSDLVTLNLSSGTPAMAAVWVLLGKGIYNTKLVQTSVQNGLSDVTLPVNIALESLKRQDEVLGELASAAPDFDGQFAHIQTGSEPMRNAVEMAKKLSPRNLPVIIQGESGTGKEVFAEAIHKASPRADKPFIAVNCGAIPETLIDSHLFGHKKGSFTGAMEDRKGLFEEANGGTLFLDEIGELPLDAQAKLLRALQQKQITPVGESKPKTVDVRIIAATHRDLLAMVDEGSFREDLFYRLAVGVVQLPPLRERQEDIQDLLAVLLASLNDEAKDQPGYQSKKISKDAIDFIKIQPWPGNIRELWNTLLRASIWSDSDMLTAEHLQRAMIKRREKPGQQVQSIDVSAGIDINQVIDKTKRHCILEALKITAGQKSKAAKLLGLPNHQTLSNWMDKLGIEGD
ncbi:sigma-54 interaction domain-containing protein [Shewanella algae]|uniref:sigma-54 interaction domain-containing protein n=1 Tax=Shewanella algae TaxID=38313 RepID=UPI0031F49BE5